MAVSSVSPEPRWWAQSNSRVSLIPQSGLRSTVASARSSAGWSRYSVSTIRSRTAISSCSLSRSAPATLTPRVLSRWVRVLMNGPERDRIRIMMSSGRIGRCRPSSQPGSPGVASPRVQRAMRSARISASSTSGRLSSSSSSSSRLTGAFLSFGGGSICAHTSTSPPAPALPERCSGQPSPSKVSPLALSPWRNRQSTAVRIGCEERKVTLSVCATHCCPARSTSSSKRRFMA